MSHDDAVRARFGATAEGVTAHSREQIEEVGRSSARSSRRCAATSARSTRERAQARSRSRSRRSSARSSASISFPSCSRPRDATRRQRDVRRRRRHGAAVRELLVRPRLLAADAAPREPARARLLGARARHASRRPRVRRRPDRAARSARRVRARPLRARGATRRTTARSSDGDFRDLFAMNDLVLVRSKRSTHKRPLDFYLGLAGCTGDDAERVKDVSPGDREHYVAESSLVPLREALDALRRATSRATRFGATACSDGRKAKQTRDGRLPGAVPDPFDDVRRDVLGLEHRAAEERAAQHRALRKPLGLDEAGVDGVHADAAPAQRRRRRARERELRVLRRRVRAARRKGDRARDRDDVDDVRRPRGLERRAGTRAGTRRRRGSSSASPARSAPGRRRGSRARPECPALLTSSFTCG